MSVRKHTKATKKKMSESHPKRPLIAIAMKAPYATRIYESTRAVEADGFASSNVTAACKRRLRHCYEFFWRYADEFESVDKVLQEAKETPSRVMRAVVGVDPEKKTFKTYPSIKATVQDGYGYDSVLSALLGRSRQSGGLFWRYAEDFESVEAVLKEEGAYDNSKEKAS